MKKCLGLLITISLLTSVCKFNVFASQASVPNAEYTDNIGNSSTVVNANFQPSFTVSLPTQIAVNKYTPSESDPEYKSTDYRTAYYKGNYDVSVTGNLGYNNMIEILPEASFNVYNGEFNKTEVAKVVQTETKFKEPPYSDTDVVDVGTIVHGVITLTADREGTYTGALKFAVVNKLLH